MTQSPTKYVTQIRKQGGRKKKKGGKCASVSVCALHFKLPTLCANV